MSEALAKVFALQQTEKTKSEQARLRAQEKQRREIEAFQNSPIMAMLREFKDLPLKGHPTTPFRTLIRYTEKELFEGRTSDVVLQMYSGSAARWRCFEDKDSNSMIYEHSKGSNVLVKDKSPDGLFASMFIEFAANCLDPNAVEAAIAALPVRAETAAQRRIMQAT